MNNNRLASFPNVTYMDTYITDTKKSIANLKNFYDTMLINNTDENHFFRVPWDDFFIKYRNELDECLQLYNLPQTYYYKPKMVSLTLYGTTDLWLSLLRANEMRNITEFHLPIIKVYNPDMLAELINIFFKRDKIINY